MNIKNRKVLVIGGGKISERRVNKFLDAGADIIIISESFTDKLKKLNEEGKIKLIYEKITKKNIQKQLDKIFLISITTDNLKMNKNIAEIAKKYRILINMAEQNEIADVIIPASFRKEDIIMSVSTQGKSPLVAKKLKERMSRTILDEDVLWLKIQNYARTNIKKLIKNQIDREIFLKNLLNNKQLQDLVLKNDENGAIELVSSLISKMN
ncbi:MAG: precorrin-2 dehydrogenase/sirohydrochlorin ferrochelatase family protein [Candidatus Helarchaeota archaeon]